ncbi:MAG TPA: YHS domain-containing protein [Anaerolineales bacterium]
MTVRDPVCGMNIELQSAFAKREHMGQTFYFCSQSCVDQFDKEPHRYMTTSATTGFNPERTLTRIELPVTRLPSNQTDSTLEPALRALPGVSGVKINFTAGKLDLEYDAGKVDLTKIAEILRKVDCGIRMW